MEDYKIAADTFTVKLAEMHITVECEFVPHSKSRNAGNKQLSLNWRCNVLRNGKPLNGLTAIDYMQGIGHAPSHRKPPRNATGAIDKYAQHQAATIEAETGRKARRGFGQERMLPMLGSAGLLPQPSATDVVSALCLDSEAIDYACFEDWADCFGYDHDSREAERNYKACLSIGLALRAAIGGDELTTLCNLAREM